MKLLLSFFLCFLPSDKPKSNGPSSYLQLSGIRVEQDEFMMSNSLYVFLLVTCFSAVYSVVLKALCVFRLVDASSHLIC